MTLLSPNVFFIYQVEFSFFFGSLHCENGCGVLLLAFWRREIIKGLIYNESSPPERQDTSPIKYRAG